MGGRQKYAGTAVGAGADADGVPRIGMEGAEAHLYPALSSLAHGKGADWGREARKRVAQARKMRHAHVGEVYGDAVIAQREAVAVSHGARGPALGFHAAYAHGEGPGRERLAGKRGGRAAEKCRQNQRGKAYQNSVSHTHGAVVVLHKVSIFLCKVARCGKNIVILPAKSLI